MATKNLLNKSRDNFLLSDDESLLDLKKIHAWLSLESYWATGRDFELVERAFAFSYPIGVYEGEKQVAVARIVSDTATFVWLCDVFVDSSYRGRGLGSWLAEAVVEWAELNNVRRLMLATKDAHEVYLRVGFEPLKDPSGWMTIDNRPQAELSSSY